MEASIPDNGRDPAQSYRMFARAITIARLPYCPAVESALACMDWNDLFHFSMSTSQISTRNVRKFVHDQVDSLLEADVCIKEERDLFTRLSTPLILSILGKLPLIDRLRFSQTSHRNAQLCAITLQNILTGILARFGLQYSDVKLLQAATGTLISGSTITSLVHNPFHPNDVDFYTDTNRGWTVVAYLRDVCGFRLHQYSGHQYGGTRGIKGVWWLVGEQDCKVNVIESNSSAMDAILRFHSSPPKGVVEWGRLFHVEPGHVLNDLALTTPAQFIVTGNKTDVDSAWNVVRKYKARGFDFVFEYNKPHACGVDLNCPATIRSTEDGGCLRAQLPTCGITFRRHPRREIISWSLQGLTCATGTFHGVSGVRPSRVHEDMIFRSTIQDLMNRNTLPSSEPSADNGEDIHEVVSDIL
ncbi:hypothetical protein B0H11DRAFT_2244302 [Mycena galericulata]|nr:hypothetical protein B0H11DRAFT_2244302 [Mycena galericulata]